MHWFRRAINKYIHHIFSVIYSTVEKQRHHILTLNYSTVRRKKINDLISDGMLFISKLAGNQITTTPIYFLSTFYFTFKKVKYAVQY